MSLLISIARSSIGRLIIGWIFENMSFIIPVNRLRETDTLLAFHHPKPGYTTHILLVPKKAIENLDNISDEDSNFFCDVFQTAQSLVDELNLSKAGYRVILNGGEYQDVPQIHFHLVSGDVVSGN